MFVVITIRTSIPAKDLSFGWNTSSLSHRNDIPDKFIDSANSSSPIGNFEYSQPHQLLHVQILLLLGSMRNLGFWESISTMSVSYRNCKLSFTRDLQQSTVSQQRHCATRPNPRMQSFISLQSSVSSKEQHHLPPHNAWSLCNPWSLRKNSNYFPLRIFPLLELVAALDFFACLLVGRHTSL